MKIGRWRKGCLLAGISTLLLIFEYKYKNVVTTQLDNTHRIESPQANQHNSSSKATKQISIVTDYKVLPPLDQLIQGKEIIGNIQPLFHFSICGFAKAGTTSLMRSLSEHNEVFMENKEWWNFFRNQARGVKTMHNFQEKHGPAIMGYKNPHDVQYSSVLDFYRQHAPQTRLVVTVRHPLTWFESFYNYRVTKGEFWSIHGEPNNLTIDPSSKPNYVNAASGAFHRYLAHLGKTPLNATERQLLKGFLKEDELVDIPMVVPNPVLLIEMRQLGDSNQKRSSILLQDIQSFLSLQHPLEPLKHVNSLAQTRKKKKKETRIPLIHICDNEYLPIRQEMMKVARNASLWIRQYFVKSPNVTVSSPEHFEALLESWMHDPCHSTNVTTSHT